MQYPAEYTQFISLSDDRKPSFPSIGVLVASRIISRFVGSSEKTYFHIYILVIDVVMKRLLLELEDEKDNFNRVLTLSDV